MAGPLADRGCTDIIFLILFIISFLVMWGIAITGYSRGKPWRLAAAYDPDSKIYKF
jgi:choline transporter-like protein 2/4/5